MIPTDNHVHTRWSWDTPDGSTMELACARAVEMGLPGLAFTEHVDFTTWGDGDVFSSAEVGARPRVVPLDVDGYTANVERCREQFPELRIQSGIEAGEPHLFAASVAGVLAAGDFERVLGSLHAVVFDGRL
jgi:histidinol-phosphatase (PHP family)